MQKLNKEKLEQFKTSKWIDVILIFIILAEIVYLTHDFLILIKNYLNKNLGTIQTISTIVLAFITLYFACENHKFQQIHLQRPHSERIGEDIRKFLEELNNAILDPRNLKESFDEYREFYKIKDFPHYPYQHLQSGYQKIYEKYNKWCEAVNSFNKKLIKFIENSRLELHEWIEKETKEDNLKPEILYDYRIISYCFKKVLIPWFPNPEHSKSSLEELQNVELTWNGPTIIRANPILVVRLEDEFIKNFITSKKEEIWKLYDEFNTLKRIANEIFEEIRIKIIDKAKYAGIIKGSCDACN
jgi:hypothetical protein